MLCHAASQRVFAAEWLQVSYALAAAAKDADFVVLEGMGRGIETNLWADFKVACPRHPVPPVLANTSAAACHCCSGRFLMCEAGDLCLLHFAPVWPP